MKKLFSKKPAVSSKRAKRPDTALELTSESSLEAMTNQRLDALIRNNAQNVEGQLGYWQLNISGRDLLVITDASHNRMRIMSPVAAQERMDEAELIRLLEANFSSALDAKYALRDGTLWSVFTHPMGELTDEQFLDCLAQVFNLANNFGSSYASSNLTFGGK